MNDRPTSPAIRKGLDDAALLDLVQRHTFRYFWDFAHPVSGLARDRTRIPDRIAVGGSGFGAMAMIVAVERGWITREQAVGRLRMMLDHLARATRYHGAFPHFLDGRTDGTIAFMSKDDGGDIVETSLLFQGLLTAREYFSRKDPDETALREAIETLWREVEWDWYTRDGGKVLIWHWSPAYGWAVNQEIRGWNECLITYVLATASPTHPIGPEAYHEGWATGGQFRNGQRYYDIELPLGPPYGGPLLFAQYSFLGLDPHGLKDRYADYWQQNVAHTRINYEYCVENPVGCSGYGRDCWGLTASTGEHGYAAFAPGSDLCVIAPTAALSSMPYAPELVMPALRHFYEDLGDRLWGEYGFIDAFSLASGWYSSEHLAVNQGPIVVMIENFRTGLLWDLFMSCREVQTALGALGFESPRLPRPASGLV
jgi:hypothetical protein